MKIFNLYFWKDFWYKQVSSRLCPRNKWATKCIPRTWRDKPELIRDFLFASIVHYVDGEKCFEVICWDHDETHKKRASEIKEIYNWIKHVRPAKEKELWDSYPKDNDLSNIKNWGKSISKDEYQRKYGKVDEIEAYILAKDTFYLKWIVENRDYLWT